jgi:predicted HAD superfamily Cof-like phosphohydrolase
MPRKKKLTPFEMVREFHVTYGLPVVETPGHPSDDRIKLRRDLISEEYWEYDRAVEKGDLVNLAQELADILYVVYGAALEYGIDLDAVVTEVHRANMSKLDADGSVLRREDGKVLKGPKYKAPDVESVLGLKEETVDEDTVA